MANISARKNKNGEIISYRIRVSRGYDSNGKQLKPYEMTWRPASDMSAALPYTPQTKLPHSPPCF